VTRKASKEKKPWWQWLFLYPSLAIALLGYIPSATQLVESYVIGVDYDKVDEAKQSNELFKKHLKCLRSKEPFVTQDATYEIRAWRCEYDILIQVEGSPDEFL